MTYRYIYKITCTTGRLKGKFYFGQHTTNDLNDGYTGSGKLIRRYLENHPNDYIKEIISYHKNKTELDKAEYNIIHPWLNNQMCLNLIEGGTGGALSEISRKNMSETKKGKATWNKGKTGIYSKETLEMMSNSHKGKKLSPCSEERKKKISESNKGKHNGYHHTKEAKQKCGKATKDTNWINKDGERKRVKDEELQKYLSAGWCKGRK